jgi:hypothetical protein
LNVGIPLYLPHYNNTTQFSFLFFRTELGRCPSFHCQCMNLIAAQFGRQQFVDLLMSLQERKSFKLFAHYNQFQLGSVAVAVAEIRALDVFRLQCGQALSNVVVYWWWTKRHQKRSCQTKERVRNEEIYIAKPRATTSPPSFRYQHTISPRYIPI